MNTQTAEFINIDMVLSAPENLSGIATELAGQIFILQNDWYADAYQLAFECTFEHQQAAPVLDVFIGLLEQLSPQAKALLARCSKKMLDIGYNSGNTAGALHDPIHAYQLKKLAEYDIDLHITIYPFE